MTATTSQPITHNQHAIVDRIRAHWSSDDTRFKPLLHAVTRKTAADIPVHPDQLGDYPDTTPDRQAVLDDALAAWDITLNAVRNVAGTLLEASEWLWLLGHTDTHTSLLTEQGTATRAYHEMTGEIAAAVQATHACDPVLEPVTNAVGMATEPVTPDDVFGLLLEHQAVDGDPRNRVLVRLALVVLADTGAIREPAPGKYLPAQQ